MTAILGVEYEGRVYLGGDTAVSLGGVIISDPDAKVWIGNGFVMGAAGSARRCQQLKHGLKVAKYTRKLTPEQWLVRKLIPAIAELFGIDSPAAETGVDVVVGIDGRLFSVDNELGFIPVGPVYGIGSGGEMALAAYDCQALTFAGIEDRIERALEQPARRLTSVSGPFHIVSL